MFVDYSHAGRDALDYALLRASPHLVPALKAVRDHDCRFMVVAQSRAGFRVPQVRPAIVIIGDDMNTSLGPPGFHVQSLRRYLTRCAAIAVMSGAAVAPLYAQICDVAASRRKCVALIETREGHEAEWYALAEECAPRASITLASPSVGGAHGR